jgi:hypothetical protein
VMDLLQPIPKAMQGQFDLVITDPMSFEGCLIAFLSRALAMVKPDGTVWACIHPLAHRLFAKVAQVLPMTVDQHAAFLSAYYYRRYENNTYRSDFFLLSKTAAALPYAPEASIPFEAITEGELTSALHGHIHCQLAASPNTDAHQNPFDALAAEDTTFLTSQSDTHFHFSQSQGGGYVAGALNRKKTNLHIQLFPFSEMKEEEQSLKLLGALQSLSRRITYMDAPCLAPPVPASESP